MQEPTYYIETYGCQMNEHDSEKMAALLDSMGMTQVDSADRAGVVVINTCAIREKSEHKVYSALGKFRGLKQRRPESVIVVAGCVAQQEKERLLSRAPFLDVVLGTHALSRLPEIIRSVRGNGGRIRAVDFSDDIESLHIPAPRKGPTPVCSYVTVMQGCSNFCAYCVVPYTRGPEQSRPADEIVSEVRELAEKGVKEITLLGQNVNAYGNDLSGVPDFPELLARLDAIEAIRRIRFTTSHPRDFNGRLAEAMAHLPSVCEHIHLPLQSGSDRILEAMGRGYSRAQYLERIAMLRELITDTAITADIIVGFPGETEKEFELTLSALQEIRYDQIFSFKYSRRPQTAAAEYPDQVPEDVKIERLARVHEIQDSITEEYHRSAEGTLQEVMIEGIRERSGQPYGRTRTNKVVNLDLVDSLQPGDIVEVRITRGLKHSLLGELSGKNP